MTTYAQLDKALRANGWRFGASEESFWAGSKRVPYGKLLKMVPGTTECEFAAWAEDKAAKMRTAKTKVAKKARRRARR
jgi:hypothetical protein